MYLFIQVFIYLFICILTNKILKFININKNNKKTKLTLMCFFKLAVELLLACIIFLPKRNLQVNA